MMKEARMRRYYPAAAALILLVLCSCGLHYSAKKGDVQGIEAALDSGAKVNQPDDRGDTALMMAAYNGHPQAVDYLCRHGADINARNPYGATALIYAAYYNQFESTKALLKYNPDKTIRDKFHNTALDYAEQYKFTGIASLLKADDPGAIAQLPPAKPKADEGKQAARIVNASEPWTGKWRVDGSYLISGVWAFKQDGNRVASTDESMFETKGEVIGKKLKGNYGRKNFDFTFEISEDGMSFTGVASDQNGLKPARGLRAN